MDPFRTPENVELGAATGITSVETLADVDTLVWEGARLIVRSPRAMPDWRVGKNRKTAVHFRGERYAVVEARVEPTGHEYLLEPWTPRAHELPAQDITYDERYVRERERNARALRARRGEALALAALWPVFGFLPSRVKSALHLRYGFMPLSSTRFSVLVELAMLPLLFLSIIVGLGDPVVFLFFAALFADAFFRVSVLFDDSYPAFGLGEWMVRPKLATVVRDGWRAVRARLREKRPTRDSRD